MYTYKKKRTRLSAKPLYCFRYGYISPLLLNSKGCSIHQLTQFDHHRPKNIKIRDLVKINDYKMSKVGY